MADKIALLALLFSATRGMQQCAFDGWLLEEEGRATWDFQTCDGVARWRGAVN